MKRLSTNLLSGYLATGQCIYTDVQSQKTVSAYFTSKQILPFGIAEEYTSHVPYDRTTFTCVT